ncbi:MAG TPA: hypothetical protein VG937_23500 [Polyangiaceae bacterium]|nr:hypothetical protein [Polyangiaceae bacterium]
MAARTRLGIALACGALVVALQAGCSGERAASDDWRNAPECQGFSDVEGPFGTIQARITNQTSGAIYLGWSQLHCGPGELDLLDIGDSHGNLFNVPDYQCPRRCQYLQQGFPEYCEPLCHQVAPIKLEPGESKLVRGNTQMDRFAQVTKSCMLPKYRNLEIESCVIHGPLEAGVYTFSAHAGTDVKCGLADATSCAESETVYGGVELTASATVTFDGATPIGSDDAPLELVFEEP